MSLAVLLAPLVVVAAHQKHPTELAVNAKNVYWVDDEKVVHRLGKTEHGDGAVLARAPSKITALVLDDASVYFAFNPDEGPAEIRRVPKRGGKAERVAKVDANVARMAMDDAYIFCIGGGGTITKVDKSNGKVVTLAESVEYSYPISLLVDDRAVYFANGLDDAVRIYRLGKSGGEVTHVASARSSIGPVFLAGGVLYYTADGVVMKTARDATIDAAPVKVIDGDLAAIGGDRIFFYNHDALHALSKKAAQAVKIFDGAGALGQAVFDSGALWFLRDDQNADDPVGAVVTFVP